VVVGVLVERLVVGVAAVYVTGAAAIVAGARVAGVAKKRVATPATIGKENSCRHGGSCYCYYWVMVIEEEK